MESALVFLAAWRICSPHRRHIAIQRYSTLVISARSHAQHELNPLTILVEVVKLPFSTYEKKDEIAPMLEDGEVSGIEAHTSLHSAHEQGFSKEILAALRIYLTKIKTEVSGACEPSWEIGVPVKSRLRDRNSSKSKYAVYPLLVLKYNILP